MRRYLVFATLVLGLALTMISPAQAQSSFQSYRCADGSQFIVGFFASDKRAHVQIDGKAIALGKRIALSGRRYSGSDVTLTMARGGVTLKRARRPSTGRGR